MNYIIGVGKSDITIDNAVIKSGLQMQGMSDPDQITTGVDSSSPLNSRAFVIQDTANNKIVAIVVADLWSGTKLLKDTVLTKLGNESLNDYNEENLLLAGTHTHSAPGGYTGSDMFDSPGGANNHVLEVYADGIVASIKAAHKNKASGKIYANKGDIQAECGKQRSAPAYENNPEDERKRYQGDTDKEMLLLKFIHVVGSDEKEIGVLNWYAIHPTDLGQTNTLVSGDNKGYASHEFEQEMERNRNSSNFVAAFANSNCGDVSGNVGLAIADKNNIPIGTDDMANMKKNGDIQFETALDLFDNAKDEVTGDLHYWHKHVDMSNITIEGGTNKRTWRYALGMSFAAGSTEDSIPRYQAPKGSETKTVPNVNEGLTAPLSTDKLGTVAFLATSLFLNFVGKTGAASSDETEGHKPKPIVLAPIPGQGLAPHYLPIQLFSIGNIAIAGVPGELTTMAGRRLRESIDNTLTNLHRKVAHVALTTYANDYAQYITTKEEYDMQHYEGASTPFGPYTLNAYKQEFENLVAESVGKGDKYIVYTSDSLYDVWFFLDYTGADGSTKTLDTADKVVGTNKYAAFTVPWDAKDIKVYAKYTKGLEARQGRTTNTVTVKLESQQAKLVTFSSEKLDAPSDVLMKTVNCKSYSAFNTKFQIYYVDADGIATGQVTGVVKNYPFQVPWNAENVQIKAKYKKWFDPYTDSAWISIPLYSGQTAEVDFRDPTVSLTKTTWG